MIREFLLFCSYCHFTHEGYEGAFFPRTGTLTLSDRHEGFAHAGMDPSERRSTVMKTSWESARRIIT
jgi:hypothetical protein